MNEAANPPTRTGPGRSCTACRRRKIRCDQQRPCGHCSRLGHECIYGAPIGDTSKSSADRLLSRLTKIESILQRIDAKVPPLTTAVSPHRAQDYPSEDPAEAGDTESRSEDGRFVSEEGDTRYLTGGFWTKLDDAREGTGVFRGTELHGIEVGPSPTNTEQINNMGLSFGLHPRVADTCSLHPPEPRIVALWQVFVDSVDPVLKVIHVPSTQHQLSRVCQDLSSVPPAFESLMFAIYYSAICSMRWSVSQKTFPREERQTLLDRYRVGLEQALTRAKLLTAPNVTTLQALAIYLTCARHIIDKSYVWTMTGLLVRLAMKLGLHHDPYSLDTSLFASEMRRRLWWVIVTLDILTAEANDTEPLISDTAYDTKLPASLDDTDLSINMITMPPERRPSLSMIFSFMRFEYAKGTNKILYPPRVASGAKPTIPERNDMVDKLRIKLEEKHLFNCDESIPIVFLARNATNLVIAKTKLTLNSPSRTEIPRMPRNELDLLIRNATDIVSFTHELRSDKRYSHWIWLFGKYIEWDAMALLLQILRTVSAVGNVEHVWNVTEAFFQYWCDWIPRGEQRWYLLQHLRREAAMKQGINISPVQETHLAYPTGPSYVGQITTQGPQIATAPVAAMNTSGFEQVQPSSHAERPNQSFTDGSTIWSFDDTLYTTRGSVDWDMYFDDDAVTAAYFKAQFSPTDPLISQY